MDLELDKQIKSEMLESAKSEGAPLRTFRKVALGAAILGTATHRPTFPMYLPPRRGTLVGVRTSAKIGRNELCPCNSGKKYKRCCGK